MFPIGIDPIFKGANTSLRDAFAIEVGADLMHWSYSWQVGSDFGWTEVLGVAGLMWMVWLSDDLALYPKVDLGWGVGWYSGWDDGWGNRPTYGGVFWDATGGVLFKASDAITLRAEGGYAGLKLGAAWLF
jgi:hypothetical protein